jgi:hypothetical protein
MDAHAMFYHSIFSIYSVLIMRQMDWIALSYVIQSDLLDGTEHITSNFKIHFKYIIFYVCERGCTQLCDSVRPSVWNGTHQKYFQSTL